jgi:hypothetical protein
LEVRKNIRLGLDSAIATQHVMPQGQISAAIGEEASARWIAVVPCGNTWSAVLGRNYEMV